METVTLSIKNVPKDLVLRLSDRAQLNHRSLQDELLSILTNAGAGQVMTVQELAAFVERIGLRTPSESAAMIREDRDSPDR